MTESKSDRTCGVCCQIFFGRHGECPKCAEKHANKRNFLGGDPGTRKGMTTIDVQEGNPE